MSDDSTTGQNGTQGHGRLGVWAAAITLLAAVAGPLVPVLIARSDDGGGPPSASGVVAASTPVTSEPSETATTDEPTDDPDPSEAPSDVQALTELIATGQGSLTDCTESDVLPDQALAAVICDTTGGVDPVGPFVYSFETQSALDDWLADEQGYFGAPDGNRCEAAGTWSGSWSYQDVPIGALACGWIDESFYMSWTFPDELIAVEAFHEDSDGLYAWWDSGPLIF